MGVENQEISLFGGTLRSGMSLSVRNKFLKKYISDKEIFLLIDPKNELKSFGNKMPTEENKF